MSKVMSLDVMFCRFKPQNNQFHMIQKQREAGNVHIE